MPVVVATTRTVVGATKVEQVAPPLIQRTRILGAASEETQVDPMTTRQGLETETRGVL